MESTRTAFSLPLEDSESDDEVPELTSDYPKVPLTIVTGYLGSGKSTLLEHILTTQHGRRIAVIVNEFGDSSDIEAKSISVAKGDTLVEEWLELDNGCLCCSVRDTGMLAIQSLMEKKGRFDYIMLETTGLADPAPIIQAFWNEPALCSDIILDSVVTVVDAVGIEKQISETRPDGAYNEAQRQIGSADVVLLNKADLVSLSHLALIEASLRSINASAVIHRTTRGILPISDLLNLNMYASPSAPLAAPAFAPFTLDDSAACCSSSSHEGHIHSPADSSPHAGDITTLSIPLPVLDDVRGGFDVLLRSLLWEGTLPPLPTSLSSTTTPSPSEPTASLREFDILRTKAFVRTTDGRAWILQGVRDVYDFTEVPPESSEESRHVEPKLVLIGRGLARGEDVRERFTRALTVALADGPETGVAK